MATELQQPQPRPDFSHVLHILPPLDDDGKILWFSYIDEPGRWHRKFRSIDELLVAATEILQKILKHETAPDGTRPRNPNFTSGDSVVVPEIEPRWSARITADLSEQWPEWALELLDESAWAINGYDLRTVRDKLARRIGDAAVEPIPFPRPTPRLVHDGGDGTTGFAAEIRAALMAVQEQLARHESEFAALQTKARGLYREQRALKAALAAYEKHAGRSSGQAAEVG